MSSIRWYPPTWNCSQNCKEATCPQTQPSPFLAAKIEKEKTNSISNLKKKKKKNVKNYIQNKKQHGIDIKSIYILGKETEARRRRRRCTCWWHSARKNCCSAWNRRQGGRWPVLRSFCVSNQSRSNLAVMKTVSLSAQNWAIEDYCRHRFEIQISSVCGRHLRWQSTGLDGG